MRLIIGLISSMLLLSSCASVSPVDKQGLQIGSATSKNLFIDSSQFYNRTVKLRMRNSSGDAAVDVTRLRARIESGLRAAGYEISDKDFGIVFDVNIFQIKSALASRVSNSRGLGVLLGGVVGYEAAKGSGGISKGAGVILGGVAGAALEEVIRNHGKRATFLALCDVNIGVLRKDSTSGDSFVIGGNEIQRRSNKVDKTTFTDFSRSETVRVAVYAGDDAKQSERTIKVLIDRLGRVVANLL